jgi:peptidoglycan/LPS O-acetylase OafA/YrhL
MLNFRRITTQKEFIPQIDGLRFVAIMSVTLFHLFASLEHNGAVQGPVLGVLQARTMAGRGVELFFVISGFILGIPFASHYLRATPRINLRRYFIRRLTRLEPPYVINLLLLSGILLLVVHQSIREIVPHLMASIFYLHNIIYRSPSTINGVAWSLEVEIQFYLLVPLLALLFAIEKPGVRRGVMMGLIFLSAVLSIRLFQTPLQPSILYYLPFFLAGFVLCDLYLTRREWKPSFRYDAIALCGWPAVWYLGSAAGHVALPFLAIVLYLAAFRGRVCSAIFSHRIITDIGGMCYSLYLFQFVISAVGRISKPWHIGENFWAYFLLQAVLVLPVVLLVAGSYYLLIERPCMDREWPRKLWMRVFGNRDKVSQDATVSSFAGGRPLEIAVHESQVHSCHSRQQITLTESIKETCE